MGKLSKNQLKRETVATAVRQAKKSTLEDLSFQFNIERTRGIITPTKAILINKISDTPKEDELALKVEFSLLPSKASFSRIHLDMFFQENLLKSIPFHITPSALLGDNLCPLALDMKGIVEGNYLIRIEMHELWSSGEKLNFSQRNYCSVCTAN